jgi:hypothetical protein
MEGYLMRFILGTIMAIAVAGIAFVQPAEARCFSDGIGVTCVRHGPMYGYGYRSHIYRDFDRPHFYRDWY